MPLHHYLSTTGATNSSSIGLVLLLQNARLILYRYNLTPLAPRSNRYKAINGCCEVAQQSAQLLSKSVQEWEPIFKGQALPTPGKESLSQIIATVLCKHLFRCTLFLLFRGDYTAALICTRASATLGHAWPISWACRQYLTFFLVQISQRLSDVSMIPEELDEELIAYLSADMQRGDASWVFGSGVSALKRNDLPQADADTLSRHQVQCEAGGNSWVDIIEQLEKLEANQLKPEGQDTTTKSSEPLSPSHRFPPSVPSSTHVQSPGGTNRMSIADILGRT